MKEHTAELLNRKTVERRVWQCVHMCARWHVRYLQGDPAAALQLVSGGQRDGGGDGRRGAGLQAVAGTDELS